MYSKGSYFAPVPATIPLTEAQRAQIAELLIQGRSLRQIAEQLQVSYGRVCFAARTLGLRPARVPNRVQKPCLELPLAQVAVLARWAKSGVSVAELALRFRVDWRPLSRELRGRAAMNPRRIAKLNRLFDALATPAA